MDLADRLRERIHRSGPIPFREWMEACLYDSAEGYYVRPRRKTGPGPDADFATSPTLHPFFAHAVLAEAAACWDACGRPAGFTVVEFGGGEGDLARDALAWADRAAPRFAEALRWLHVERSPHHLALQAKGADPRIGWADSMPDLPHGFVLANEFLDALPFDWLEATPDGVRHVAVDWHGKRFKDVLGAPAPAPAPAGLEPGSRFVRSPGIQEWWHGLRRLRRGGVLVVDYGERAERLWQGRPDGSVRSYRQHRLVSPLDHPGESDVTAHVDFTANRDAAAAAGWREASFETQEAFLLRHGILDELNRIPRNTRAAASDYLRLRQLLLPTGLGAAFKAQRFEKAESPLDALRPVGRALPWRRTARSRRSRAGGSRA